MSIDAHSRPRSFVVAISGASGACYAARTVAALLEQGCQLDLVVTDFGRRLLRDELGVDAAVETLMPFLEAKYGEQVRRGRYTLHSNRDLGATIASGSRTTDGMVIVPCSMKTLAGVANGLSRTLVERAADVMLKERKPLLLVPRETPMSLPQLRNMVLCAEAGAVLVPAMPAFYQGPKTLDDLADFMAGKILSLLGVEHQLYPLWSGQVER
ncbi:MAG: UbiX family flavin prenyltransferase [Acidobacteriota bacterium]